MKVNNRGSSKPLKVLIADRYSISDFSMFWSYYWLKKESRAKRKIEEIQRLGHKKSKVLGRYNIEGGAPDATPHPLVPPNTVFE